MTRVTGVRFKHAGLVYYFNPGDMELAVGEDVVVDTARGASIGKVVVAPKEVNASEISEPLKSVLRKAQLEDLEQIKKIGEMESEALVKCEELVERFHLPMKLLSAEYNLDGSYLTIYFKSEKRVDFRALLRELSSTLKTRVELRQVGTRDAAKLVGGVGRCGRPLCCATHLTKFETISMKMAREQNLPLNPTNISGVCSRLLCCLAYENEQYREMKQKLPPVGQAVDTRLGAGKVIGVNPLKATIGVQLESEALVELPASDIKPCKQ
jgi:cell fate regulator YaaT (PSP1 superfamily)